MADVSELTLPILPLPNGVVLPQMVITLALETPEAQAAADGAGEDGRVVLVPSIDGRHGPVGVVARIESSGNLPSGTRALVVRALHRARIRSAVVGTTDALWVEVEPVEDPRPTERARELAIELRAAIRALLEGGDRRSRLADALPSADEPGVLADAAGWWPDLSTERKVQLLETIDPEARVELVLAWAKEALAERELSDRIRTDVADGMEKTQRDFMLRQQMAAIRKELGEDGDEDLTEGFRRRLDELGDHLPDASRDAIAREIDRLEQTNAQAVEHGWIRTWLDTVLDVPWATRTTDRLDLVEARGVLDADHFGLDEVKDRIVEFLAVRKLKAERAERAAASAGDGPSTAGGRPQPVILALVGPPGVGKTSLGESVARTLGREFVRVALGGVRDEAEIRGHRRTYVGAQPGRIVRALQEAGSMNPVFLLDEIDKVGSDWRGDPSSALLEVLDPAQNHSFRDHYLEVELDLSDVVFIATANVLDTVPPPLLDRLEVVRLDGYTEDEKLAIARDHLLPRQESLNGLRPGEVAIGEDAIRKVVADYTREAGVRGLERALARLLRKAAVKLATAPDEAVVIGPDQVADALGRPAFRTEVALRTSAPGVATGLAVTGAGGDVLFVEATATGAAPAPGTSEASGQGAGLTVTGQLGDVMKESASIALSFVRSRSAQFGIAPGADRVPVHVHVPAGAVPKDGPSAGVTLTTALVSLFTGRPVRSTLGMTGEVTLHGRVLPIGGVKQKVLAAHRAGLDEVVLPAENGPDLDDLPEAVRDAMTFHLVDDVADVIAIALEPAGDSAESEAA